MTPTDSLQPTPADVINTALNIDPTVKAKLSAMVSESLVIVDREDECGRLQQKGYRATYLEVGAPLNKRLLSGSIKYVAALQRPGPEGATFGVHVLNELSRQGWRRELIRGHTARSHSFPGDPGAETAGDDTKFVAVITDCLACGVKERLTGRKAATTKPPVAILPTVSGTQLLKMALQAQWGKNLRLASMVTKHLP